MSFSRKPKTINPDKVDPSVYYYDEVYDDMKDEQKSEHGASHGHGSSSKDKPKGSKYIDGLKETANLRKTEKELRKFKRYTRDREEAEAGGEISREDVYVSDSYKRKLKEIKRLEDEKRRQNDRDEAKSMNFAKKHKTDRSAHHRESRRHKSEGKSSPRERERPFSPTPDESQSKQETSEKKEAKKRPKTLKERREYLRSFLKKRTVGKVYDEALQRYMLRKALSQR